MTGFPGRAQHLVDKVPAAATIADASQPDIEFVIAAVHGCALRAFLKGQCRKEF